MYICLDILKFNVWALTYGNLHILDWLPLNRQIFCHVFNLIVCPTME